MSASETPIAPRPRRVIAPRWWPLLLTAQDAAAYLGMAVSSLYMLRESDSRFPETVRIPGRTGRFYRREDLRDYVRALRAAKEE